MSRTTFRGTACFLLGLVIISCSGVALASGGCNGKQSYRLRITMRWVAEEDKKFPDGGRVPAVFAVSHTSNFTLFKVGEELDRKTVDFLRNQKPRAMSEKLRRLVSEKNASVVQFDHVTAKGPEDLVRLTVELDGDRNATLVSFIGLVFPTPDFFFGATGVNMCNGTHFLDKLPKNNSILWAGAFDGGIDARQNISQRRIIVSEPVRVDNRTTLRNGYAFYTLTPGSYKRPFSKIYAIAGGLALLVLLALLTLWAVNQWTKRKARVKVAAPAATA